MRRRRPCRICRQWFEPHARAGDRQGVCGRVACQRERHRRACASWRAQNPEYDREERLRQKLQRGEDGVRDKLVADPLPVRIDLRAARDAVGLEVFVFIEETAKVLVGWARDAVLAQGLGMTKQSAKVPPSGARDAMGADRSLP
jgi:hypothetical protein